MTTLAGRATWAEPLVEEVSPGVHRIPLPLPMDGLHAVNVYAVAGPDGLLLIDGGWALAASRARLARALAELGAGVGDVRRLLVTHAHRDHYTQAVALRRDSGAPVALGAGEREVLDLLRDPDRPNTAGWAAQLVAGGAPELARRLPALLEESATEAQWWELPDTWLDGGEVHDWGSRQLHTVATPGHTRGHLVFVDEAAGLLFAGDHVLPHITPSIGFEAVPAALPLGAYLQSLARVRAMPDATLLPAHGPVTASAHARIDELLDHHRTRLDDVEAAVAAGASAAATCAGRLGWTSRGRPLDGLDPVNQVLAVLETIAHLELLLMRGRLSVEVSEGVRHYTAR
jgi:glyoxylase-like metal-dependent hydrolase (beta-lactamase superfamily II)